MCFPCVGTKHIKANGKHVLEVFIHSTVYVEFRVCFAMAKKENDMFLLCETSNAFIGAFCYSEIHFHPAGLFKSIKIMSKSLHVFVRFISSTESLFKGWPQERDYLAFNNWV